MKRSDIFVAAAVLLIIVLIIVPLSPELLDILFDHFHQHFTAGCF